MLPTLENQETSTRVPAPAQPAGPARWNETSRAYPACPNLKELFEAQVQWTPDALAVISPHESAPSVSYAELNRRANRLARHLQSLGVGPDVIVGVCLERSIHMVVAVLAVLKAGGAYAALDPSYPKDRLAFMIGDTRAPVILTEEKLRESIPGSGAQLISLDRDFSRWESLSPENPSISTGPDHLAYLIYTSGSTGQPKGVAMRQAPLVNLLYWQIENFSSPNHGRTLQFASLNFDVSFQEIFSTWCSGGALVLIDDTTRRDASALVRFIAAQEIQRVFLPFVALKHLAEAAEREQCHPSTLREVITAGEQLQITPSLVRFFSNLPDCTLENQYGPSEAHVVTAFRLHGSALEWPLLPSIGGPIANTQIHILDEKGLPLPARQPGELFIGGVCLARGYLNRPDLTAEKFVPDPFSEDPAARLYKSGDLAQWHSDGTLEFLGRIDHQVKIRGFRVELGEIEATLSRHPGLRENVVVARDSANGDKQLVAYIVSKNGPVPTADLRAFLREKLPAHFVPSTFVALKSLPLTPNGKVDRRALPAPGESVENSESPAGAHLKLPQNPLEMQLKLVFERFLNTRPISTDASFFELGGDSLQALKLIVEVERVTRKKLPLSVLFQSGTVEGLANFLEKDSPGAWSSLVPLQPLGSRPPLYLVHTTPGDVLGYGNLIFHLGTDQPCFGFQSLGFHDPDRAHTRVDEMAAYYIKELRQHQPHGPYRLGGWCYGGILAVEMAHQLRAAGEQIDLLALIETPAPAPPLGHWRYYARRLRCLLTMSPRQWTRYLKEKIRYYRGVKTANEMRFKRVSDEAQIDPVAAEERNRFLARLERVYHTNLDALHTYVPTYYPGPIVLFNAAEQDPAMVHDSQYGWPPLARDIETEVVPGDHDTILMEPNVRDLAAKLSRHLSQTATSAPGPR